MQQQGVQNASRLLGVIARQLGVLEALDQTLGGRLAAVGVAGLGVRLQMRQGSLDRGLHRLDASGLCLGFLVLLVGPSEHAVFLHH
ncbi:hypothetical protein D3C83_65500 [compost metagenome]